jgi:hypothetical protein
VGSALNTHRDDRGAFDRRQQHAAQAVADGVTKALLERLDDEPAVLLGQGRAVGHDLAGQFEVAPTDSHSLP